MPTEVGPAVDLDETLGSQQLADRRGLIVTVLQHQPATGLQVLRSLGDDQPQVVQTILARHQGAFRLETHVAGHQMGVGFGLSLIHISEPTRPY